MRKNVFGRQFKRDANERKALFKNLLTSLIIHEQIKTTEEKAKAVKAQADKLVTRAKKDGISAYRNLEPQVSHKAVEKLINVIAPRFISRPGGYTRIIKTGRRTGDNASMVLMQWTEMPLPKVNGEDKTKNNETNKKQTKKVEPKKKEAKKTAKKK